MLISYEKYEFHGQVHQESAVKGTALAGAPPSLDTSTSATEARVCGSFIKHGELIRSYHEVIFHLLVWLP